jgi:alcohol dehydrogenase
MKAVVFGGIGKVKVTDLPKPALQKSTDVIVKVTHATICGSDLNILNGKIPVEEGAIMGHEAIGVIEEAGKDVTKAKKGDRVVVSYSVQCGTCDSCKRGLVVFCEKGGMLGHGATWGGFGGCQAEYLRVPWADANLQPIPAGVTEDEAMLITDNLATGYQGCEYGSVGPGDVVAVFGAGPVGLCAMACARLFGASMVVGVDLQNHRLEAAKRLGVDAVINPKEKNPAEEIKILTNGRGADVAIEAVGRTETFDFCFESVRKGGRISILGVFPFDKVGVSLRNLLRWNMQIRAGRANMIHMEKLMLLVSHRKLNMTSLITHRLPLSDAVEAYRIARSQTDNALKVMLKP